MTLWQDYYSPSTLEEALGLLREHGDKARIVAGGTDLVLELERGVRRVEALVDVTRLPGLDEIRAENGVVHLGARVTHGQAVTSSLLVERAFPLAMACWQVGSPQIRNRATIAGNLANASPAGDTITPLWALDASVILASQQRGQRQLPLGEFFLGVRRTALLPDEMLVAIRFPALRPNERGAFVKLGLRQAQAIAVVNVAVGIGFEGDRISRASIALGSVAPTIVRAAEAEESLVGRPLTPYTIARAARLASDAARPIDDIRGSAAYRRAMVRVLTSRALHQLLQGRERAHWPQRAVTLAGMGGAPHDPAAAPPAPTVYNPESAISFTVNGQPVVVRGAHDKTLLRLLREDLGLTGAKEGCAEGECGACTVWLDGMAVQSCLVPAPQVAGRRVTTIEGLAVAGQLHPVQQSFIEEGAVQCGYCTPGLIMSAAGLLQQLPQPSRREIQEALTGNLCRCTGYEKVIHAIEKAALAL
jgi:xanthine dehydrogenase iron-sulfur cluster and FAD-binding subunit A